MKAKELQTMTKYLPQNQESETATKTKWGPGAAVGITIVIYFLSQILAIIILSIYPALRNWRGEVGHEWLQNSTAAQFLFVLLVELITVGALFIFLKYRKTNLKALGFHRWPKLTDLSYSLIGLGLYFPAVLVIISLIKKIIPALNVDQQQQIGFENVHGNGALFLTFFSLVVLPPLAEEILARGFLYGGLKKRFSPKLALLFTSLIFGAAHLQFGSGQPLLWVAAIDTFVLSIALCKLKDLTGNLWSSIGLHILKNGVAFLILFKPFMH